MTPEREATIRQKGTELAGLRAQLRDNDTTVRGGKSDEEIAQLAADRDALEGKISELEYQLRQLKYPRPHERG